MQLMRLGYVAGLAALVVVLSAPSASQSQRAPIAPLLGTVNGLMQPSFQQAQQMVLLGGEPMGMMILGGGLTGGPGGFGLSGFGGGFSGFGGGFSGFGGGFGGFNGFGGGFGNFGFGNIGFGGGFGNFGFGGGFNGFGGFGGGLVGLGGGFAGKGFGGFNGEKAL
jgi:hypothetical protein